MLAVIYEYCIPTHTLHTLANKYNRDLDSKSTDNSMDPHLSRRSLLFLGIRTLELLLILIKPGEQSHKTECYAKSSGLVPITI